MLKRLLRCILCIALLFTITFPAFAGVVASGAPEMFFWNSSKYTLSIEEVGSAPSKANLLFTSGTKQKILNNRMPDDMGFYVCGDIAVYYAQNDKGKYKWFTYNMATGASRVYAYSYLSPFWADANDVYTTTGGKRVYDYNIFRFNPNTGKKASAGSVYGMPIGYVGQQLIALDFYHKQLCYYEGSKLVKKIPAAMRSGFIVNGNIYLILADGVYLVDGGQLKKVIDRYIGAQEVYNGSRLLYLHGAAYPKDVYLVTAGGVNKLGTAQDDPALHALKSTALKACKVQ